jgi:hypothetical protein
LLYLSGARRKSEVPKPRKISSYREAARILGGLLGEKIYFAMQKGWVRSEDLKSLLFKRTDESSFDKTYFELIELVESWPDPFQSKQERL